MASFFHRLVALVTNKIFIKNIIGMVVTIFLLIYATLWVLDFYTNHGTSYEITDFEDMNLDEAKEMADKNGFKLVVTDSIYLEGKDPNIVLQQNPKPGVKVKKDRAVYVTTTKVVPDLVILPTMAGGNDNYDLYNKKLNALGIHGKIKSKVSNFKYAENTIVEVWFGKERITFSELKKEKQIPKGSTIECVITKKSVDYIDVPNLKCRTLNEADFILNSYGLKLGKIDKSNVDNENIAFISWQSQPASSVDKIAVGASINVTLVSEKPKDCN